MPEEGHGHEARKTQTLDHNTNTHAPSLKRQTQADGQEDHGEKDIQFHHKRSDTKSEDSSEASASAGTNKSSGKSKSPPPTQEHHKERIGKERHVDLSNVEWKSGASRKVGFQGKGHRESHMVQQLRRGTKHPGLIKAEETKGVGFHGEHKESYTAQQLRRGTKHPGLIKVEEGKGVGFHGEHKESYTAQQLRRGTKHPGLLKLDDINSESDDGDGGEDLKRASWTTASFTEVPNALDELEQQHHPSRTSHHVPHHHRQSEGDKKQSMAPTTRSFASQGGQDMHALLMKHRANSKGSVLAKYFKANMADEGTQAGVPTSNWLSRLEQMLIHFFLMIFESSTHSSKLILEMMPTEASTQIDEIFQLLLKAEPEMYKEMGNLVSIAENWLILSREDSEKRQKALDYVRMYMNGVKSKNYYKLPIQVRLHKLGAFITGLNAMGKGQPPPVKYPVLKENPPVNQFRLGSPRVKPATHFSRVVANILTGRPCDDPLPIEDVYADKLAKSIFKNTLHGDKEFKTYTDKKYGSMYKKSDLFSPFLKVDAMAVQGGGDSDVAERFIHKDDCLQNTFCWLPKYTRSYVENLKGNGCELLAQANFDKGIERAICAKDKSAEACKQSMAMSRKKAARLNQNEWVRGADGRLYRKTAYNWGQTSSADSIFMDPRDGPDGKGGRHGGKGGKYRSVKSGKGYANKASSDTKLAKHGYGRSHHAHGHKDKGYRSKGVQSRGLSPSAHKGAGPGPGGAAAGRFGHGRGAGGPGVKGGPGQGAGRGNKKLSQLEVGVDASKKLKTTGAHAYRLEGFSPLDGSGDSGPDDKKKGHGAGGGGGASDDEKDRNKKNKGGLPGVSGGPGGVSKDKGTGTMGKYGNRAGPYGQSSGALGRGGRSKSIGRGGYGHDRGSKFGLGVKDIRKTFLNRRTMHHGGRDPGRRDQYSITSDEWGGEDYDLDYFMLGNNSQDEGRGDDPHLLSLNQCWEKAAKLLKKPNKSLVIPPAENLLLYLEKKFAKARWARGSPVATRHYPNGSLFVAQYGNGASRVFYPHGGLAADISGPSPSTSQVLLVRDPSDGIFFFDKALLADLNSSGKGVIYNDDGLIKAQYSAIGGFKMDGMEKGQRWQWNQGGQRLTMKLNNFLSLRLSDQDRIFLNYYGNSRGFFVNVASGREVILMNPKRKDHDPIAHELKNLVRPKVEDDHFDYVRGHFKSRPTLGFVDKPKHYSEYYDAEMRDMQRKSTKFFPDNFNFTGRGNNYAAATSSRSNF